MKRTGVVVGVRGPITSQQAQVMLDHLGERFPLVTFAVVDGGSSVAFEWDEPGPVYKGPEVEFEPDWMLRP